MNLRIGFGYDIHRLEPGRPLFLGGVRIPHDRGMVGHSDGDAVAHALADALLSAAHLGDLGDHFPSGDPQWAGAAGARILVKTRQLLEANGASLVNADLTVVAEAPRLSPHREAMGGALAAALGCDPAMITVKARTNEGLGEIGRGDAIAAYSMVLVRLGRERVHSGDESVGSGNESVGSGIESTPRGSESSPMRPD
jgi:2-C-methyl-D-erythritol 2,4-cyclodiphosphate synthase